MIGLRVFISIEVYYSVVFLSRERRCLKLLIFLNSSYLVMS